MNSNSIRAIRNTAVLIVGIFAVGTAYTNCSSSLPDAALNNSSSSTRAQASPLTATVSSAQIFDSQSATITTIGGTPPYKFVTTSGQGNVSVDGLIGPPYAQGTLTIHVTDQSGQAADVSVSILPTPAASASSCLTPFGTSIAVGTSVMAYSASSVNCPSVCASETRTCMANGQLSGTYTASNCAVVSCVFQAQPFQQGFMRNPTTPTQAEVCGNAPPIGSPYGACTYGSLGCYSQNVHSGQGGSNSYTSYTLYKCSSR